MAKYCTYCSAALEENAEICTACGEKVLTAENNDQPKAEEIASVQTPVQPPKASVQAEPTGKYAVASTSSFFWLSLLFAIPVIGFICSIIFNFASKNLNTKHYARSVMLWNIVAIAAALILTLIGIVFCLFLGVTLADIFYELGFYFTF